jgi:hypothetical protein
MKKLLMLIIIFTIAPISLFADRGSIPFKPHVKIFEPKQRAMIAWNGKEEILLLSTDLRASEPTKVLEVMPLPSEPEVKKGDVEVFKKATDLINKKLAIRWESTRSLTKGAIDQSKPAGEITFHKKIGAHDISVTHVLNTNGFTDWVEDYLKSADVENPKIPEGLKTVINEYLEEGFSWFVFDVVELDKEPKTNQAIQYRFETDFLYYPLKITRTEEGFTTIDLLILTPKLLSNFPGIPAEKVQLSHKPVSITGQELLSLNKDMYNLLDPQKKNMKLRIWKIEGKLSSFDADLIAKEGI